MWPHGARYAKLRPVSPMTSRSITPESSIAAQLLAEEQASASIFGRVLAMVAGSATLFVAFFEEATLLRTTMQVGCVGIVIAGLYSWRRAEQGTYNHRVFRGFYGLCVLASFPIQLYLGVFSASSIAITLGICIFGASDDKRGVLVLSTTANLGYCVMAVPIALHLVPDPGVLGSQSLGPVERAFYASMVPFVYTVTMYQSWVTRRVTRDAVIGLHEALGTAHEATRRAEEAARLKQEFLTNMNHEVNTPLNAVLGFAEMLQHTDLDESQRELAKGIQRGGDDLLSLLTDIQLLSRLTSGELTIQDAPVDLRRLLRDATQPFVKRAAQQDVKLTSRVETNVPLRVLGDSERLSRMLTPLLDNALRFTSEGGAVQCRLSVDEVRGGAAWTRFEIEDTGVGIASEHQQDVLEAFRQVDGSVTRDHEGAGLGLTIASHLAQTMGGALDLQSAPSEGTTVSVVVPLALVTDGARAL